MDIITLIINDDVFVFCSQFNINRFTWWSLAFILLRLSFISCNLINILYASISSHGLVFVCGEKIFHARLHFECLALELSVIWFIYVKINDNDNDRLPSDIGLHRIKNTEDGINN